MPTLAEKGKFTFHDKAKNNIPNELKGMINESKAIDIIVRVLELKLSKTGKDSRTYFLRGRTGSGKSTYMIQELYRKLICSCEERTTIFCTQPRVVLTKSNPTELLRYNKGWEFGKNIGVRNGSEKIGTTDKYSIVYCTTQIMGNLLVELMSETDAYKQEQMMKAMRLVVIDECHVLDSPMMALLKNVYDVVSRFGENENCPLFIFSSATIDLENMVKYYYPNNYNEMISDPLMIGDVIGVPNFPVSEDYLSSSELKVLNETERKMGKREAGFELFAKWFADNYLNSLFKSESTIKRGDEIVKCRDALLFVPLFSAISFIGDYLEKYVKNMPFFKIGKDCQWSEVEKFRNKYRNKERVIYVGYGRNYAPASDEILSTAMERDDESRKNEVKIICSTSVIETGKTISTLYLCMNMGIETMSLYNPLAYKPENALQCLKQCPINKNQCIQRKGRVGRECPGKFVHFYSKECYDKFRNIDVAETINNSYLSALVLNDLSQFPIGTCKDVFNLNNYYYPTSTDILINSTRDLVNSGYLTLFGQYTELNNSVQHSENWIIYAKYLFYCLGWSLWDSLLLASLNRKNLPPMMTLYNINPNSLRIQLKDVNEEMATDEVIEGIQRARNTMTSILYGNDQTFKCVIDRAYNNQNTNNNERITNNDNMNNNQNINNNKNNDRITNNDMSVNNNNMINNGMDERIELKGKGLTNNNNKNENVSVKPFDSWYSLNKLNRL